MGISLDIGSQQILEVQVLHYVSVEKNAIGNACPIESSIYTIKVKQTIQN